MGICRLIMEIVMADADVDRVPDEHLVDYSDQIRDITDEEVETFWKNGWVYVPGFITKNLCDQVIQHYADWTGLKKDWPADEQGQQEFIAAIESLAKRKKGTFAIRQEDAWMFNYVTQRKFGEAAARFLKVPEIKVLSETLHVKYPASSGHSRELVWHQDFPSIPIDRAEAVQFWAALVPITPEMGPMVHLNGSHRTMPGGILAETSTQENALELYPELFEEYETSTPLTYAPGDAIFHHSLTWHRSGENHTDKVRWAMSSYRFSARSRYTGQANLNTDGLGLEPRKHFDHPNFPTVFP
jgi:ectoine hydroxylase-related dioxygenase (phytanoyl-CoA dioxygenase family)